MARLFARFSEQLAAWGRTPWRLRSRRVDTHERCPHCGKQWTMRLSSQSGPKGRDMPLTTTFQR